MRNPRSYVISVVLTFVLAACGVLGSVADVTGNWSGQLTGPNGAVPFSMSLTQSGTSVIGTVTLFETSLSISGTVAGNVVTLGAQDEAAGFSIQIGGTVDGNNMTGTVTLTADGQTGVADFTATNLVEGKQLAKGSLSH